MKKNSFKRFIVTFSVCFMLMSIFTLNGNILAKGNVSKPTISKIYSTNKAVQLFFKSANNAKKYDIYKKVENSKYKKIATLSSKVNKYTDKDIILGKKSTYKVVINGSKIASEEKSVTPVNINAPKLKSSLLSTSKNKTYATINFESKKGGKYKILRKTAKGSFKAIATVKAKGTSCSYKDSKNNNKNYIYTVRRYVNAGKTVTKLGSYDTKGISVFNAKPSVKIDSTNLHTKVSWNKVSGASGYAVYRKVGLKGSYRRIGTVSSADSTYTDVYHDSMKTTAEKTQLMGDHFVDPSINKLVYTVRAYKSEDNKNMYSKNYVDGDFNIITPVIVRVSQGKTTTTVEWGESKNAVKYYIYTGYNDSNGNRHWKKVASVKDKGRTRQSAKFKTNKSHPYFTVKAVYKKNGKTIYSKYDTGFTVKNRGYSKTNVLFLGDSITFGSPYKGVTTREVFSYPWRVNQLTGINYYNPSIPGSTYAYKSTGGRYRIITDVAEKIENGLTPAKALHENSQTYKDFDVVVMAAGTNDYGDNIELGDLNSTDIKNFNGAVNKIMSYIKNANVKRVAAGKDPIKVVFVDLFYSDRIVPNGNESSNYNHLNNRFTTENALGLTLTDYQENLNDLYEQYKTDGFDMHKFSTSKFATQATCPYVTSDNLHMTRFNYTQIGNDLTDYLIKNNIIRK